MKLACAFLLAAAGIAPAADKPIEQRVAELERIVSADPVRQDDGLAGRVAELEKIVSANPVRRDDGLAGRVEALEKAAAGQKAPDAELRRDLRRLEDRFAEMERRLTTFERDAKGSGGDREFTELRRDLQSMSREITTLSRDLQALDRRVSNLENRR